MRTFSGKRSTLALAIAGITAMSGFVVAPQVHAEGFIDDSTLTGGIYYWQRERDRKDVTDHDKYKTKVAKAAIQTKLHSRQKIKAMMKITPAIRAELAFIKQQPNLNSAQPGRAPVTFNQPDRLCWLRTGALCQVPIRVLKPEPTSTMVMLVH